VVPLMGNGNNNDNGTEKNLYGLTAGQCEFWNGKQNRKGLTAGQCEFSPQGDRKTGMVNKT